MNKGFRERLALIKAKYNLTYSKLAEVLKVSDDVAGNYLSGRTPMPIEKMVEMCTFLRIDPDWLLVGKGINPLADLGVSDLAPTYRKAHAGRSVASNHRVHLRTLLAAIVDDLPEDIYDVFEVEGASMETTLSQGDKLLCRKDTVENIQDNRVYVLVTDDPEIREFRPSGVWIKRCSHRKNNGYISCRSDNKDTTEPYNTFRLKSSAIVEVWYPVMKITHHMADPNRDIYNRLDELESRIEMLEDLNQ